MIQEVTLPLSPRNMQCGTRVWSQRSPRFSWLGVKRSEKAEEERHKHATECFNISHENSMHIKLILLICKFRHCSNRGHLKSYLVLVTDFSLLKTIIGPFLQYHLSGRNFLFIPLVSGLSTCLTLPNNYKVVWHVLFLTKMLRPTKYCVISTSIHLKSQLLISHYKDLGLAALWLDLRPSQGVVWILLAFALIQDPEGSLSKIWMSYNHPCT
jgi:glucose-6-phosphate-specific signal transduction histidine kinase